jgi:hypothetical protein
MVWTNRNKIGSSISLSVRDISFLATDVLKWSVLAIFIYLHMQMCTYSSVHMQILTGLQLLIAPNSLAAMQHSAQIYVFHA